MMDARATCATVTDATAAIRMANSATDALRIDASDESTLCSAPPLHIYRTGAEAFCMLSGGYFIFVEGEGVLMPGWLVHFIPAGVPHGFRVAAERRSPPPHTGGHGWLLRLTHCRDGPR